MNNENYLNQFFTSVPKKQAKSYEIELGQNEGAYKEELLIRYGDNTINHMMNKKQQGTKMNLEDIMKMNEQLKPFQERPKFGEQESYAVKCEKLEDSFGLMDERNAYLNKFEEDLRAEIDDMTESIFKLFDDTQNDFNPQLYEKYKELKNKIKDQKDENANLMKQLDLLMQENAQIMDMVYKVGGRLENLEKKVGIDKNAEEQPIQEISQRENENNYKEEEEEGEMEGEAEGEGEEEAAGDEEMMNENLNESLENEQNNEMNQIEMPPSEHSSDAGKEEEKEQSQEQPEAEES